MIRCFFEVIARVPLRASTFKHSVLALKMWPNAFFLPLLFQIYPAAVSSLHQGIRVLCRGCWYFPLFLVPAANSYTVNFFPWHTSQSSLTSVVRMVHRSGEYDFVPLDRCKQASCFCCCKGNVSHAVQIHHFSSAAPWTSTFRCKHSNEAPSYNFLYGFCSQYGLKCGKTFSVISCTQTDFLSSPWTAETLSAVAQSSGRTWQNQTLISAHTWGPDELKSVSQHC